MVKDLDKKGVLLYTTDRQVPRGPKVNPETGFLRIATPAQVKTMSSGRSAVFGSPASRQKPGLTGWR
jgi:hypothetical protein